MVVKFNDYELMIKSLWEMNKELQIWSYKKAYRVDYDLCEIVCIRKDVADILIKFGGKVLQDDIVSDVVESNTNPQEGLYQDQGIFDDPSELEARESIS